MSIVPLLATGTPNSCACNMYGSPALLDVSHLYLYVLQCTHDGLELLVGSLCLGLLLLDMSHCGGCSLILTGRWRGFLAAGLIIFRGIGGGCFRASILLSFDLPTQSCCGLMKFGLIDCDGKGGWYSLPDLEHNLASQP